MNNIVIDFDGTILPHVFPVLTEPYPETKDALQTLKASGFNIIIHTVRTANFWTVMGNKEIPSGAEAVNSVKDYLDKYEIPYDDIWLADKPIAMWYVDDRAINIKDGDWKSVLVKIIEGRA